MSVRQLTYAGIARPISFTPTAWLSAFALLHIPIALLMRSNESFPEAHRLTALTVAVAFAALGRSLERALGGAVYVVGAEVLWRMAAIDAIWEFSKYVGVFVFLTILVRFFRNRHQLTGPSMYFAVLIPSSILTFSTLDPAGAREGITFNLIGPLLLTIAAIVLRQVDLPFEIVRRMLWLIIAPAVGIATMALATAVEAGAIVFDTESNFVTSGGFGPNQVSASLSFAALCCVWLAIEERRRSHRILPLALALWFVTQDILTFSRTGAYALTFALLGAGWYLSRKREHRARAALTFVAFALVMAGFVLPRLQTYTSNALGNRFVQTTATGRLELAKADVQTWRSSILLGVGPGVSKYGRQEVFIDEASIAAHTEGTRLLAEHGLFGVLAFLTLIGMLTRSLLRQRDPLLRAWVAAFGIWSMATMTASAMRTANIALAFGFAVMSRSRSDTSTEPVDRTRKS